MIRTDKILIEKLDGILMNESSIKERLGEVIRLGNLRIEKLSRQVKTKTIDKAMAAYWDRIFEAENLMGIKYTNEDGYSRYPVHVFKKFRSL